MYRTKPLLAPPRPKLPLVLYVISIVLSCLLFYWSGLYCRWNSCTDRVSEAWKSKQYAQYFPACVAPLIGLFSVFWLLTSLVYPNTPCHQTYNCMEMPTSVFCSLLAGVSAVIEIHYSIEYAEPSWSERWSWITADAIALGGVHAVLAFALQ
ncbi:unnamed protein product, partial [Mesorhabditis spiculigera]